MTTTKYLRTPTQERMRDDISKGSAHRQTFVCEHCAGRFANGTHYVCRSQVVLAPITAASK